MRIVSVQVGAARSIDRGGRTIRTGHDKRPVERIVARTDGVEDDAVLNGVHHGGPGQAVYLYARSDYEVFEAALGVELAPGSFAENVTVDAWPHDPVRIGDVFTVAGPQGEGASLQVSAPRVPCATFAARMHELVGPEAARGWVRRFTEARRPGWYARVLVEGALQAGQVLDVHPAPASALTGLELWDLHHERDPDPAAILRALEAPIDDRSRVRFGG